jgi:hypothetical protein
VLVCALRRIALAGTELAKATCGSIRLKLLKIGAQVTVSVRRVKFALASACPFQDIFAAASTRLRKAAASTTRSNTRRKISLSRKRSLRAREDAE